MDSSTKWCLLVNDRKNMNMIMMYKLSKNLALFQYV